METAESNLKNMKKAKTNAKIQEEVDSLFEIAKESLKDTGDMPTLIILYDDEGEPHSLSFEQMQDLFNNHKDAFTHVMRGFIEFLAQKGITIVESVIFQCVYYSSMKKGTDYKKAMAKKGIERVSEDPDSEQALMIVRETKDHVTMEKYHLIFDKEETTAAMSSEPMPISKMDKHAKGEPSMESWFIGFVD